LLAKRGSSIYRDKPDFSIFGVGEYTFSPWKVAIAGMYKSLGFVKVGMRDGKPIVFDDTTNFLPCPSEAAADLEVAPNCRTLQVLSLAAKLSGQGVCHEEAGKSQRASGCASDVQ
jgi:hypothetical protein